MGGRVLSGGGGGRGVLLSILALVEMSDSGSVPAGGEARGCVEEEQMLASRHEPLQTLAALVRSWRLGAEGDGHAHEGGSAAGDGGVEIELLVAASCSCCSAATGTQTHDAPSVGCCCGNGADWRGEGARSCGGDGARREHLVRNSLLDAAEGRFVVWATPAVLSRVRPSTWLADVVASALHAPLPAPPQPHHTPRHAVRGGVAREWDASVLESLAERYRGWSAGGCSWEGLGPVLRSVALFVRFRDVWPRADDDAARHGADAVMS